jgi:hypothetical protein
MAGRATDLTRLDTELRSVRAGELRVILLVGEAGVGKTRLAREFQSRHRSDTIGLRARGYPKGSTAANKRLFFTADDGTSGRELWKRAP